MTGTDERGPHFVHQPVEIGDSQPVVVAHSARAAVVATASGERTNVVKLGVHLVRLRNVAEFLGGSAADVEELQVILTMDGAQGLSAALDAAANTEIPEISNNDVRALLNGAPQ